MHLRIVHSTGYTYDGSVGASYNEARLTPLTQPGQLVTQARVDVSPKPWTYGYRDYWGSQVTAFEVLEPHLSLTVVGTSVVHTMPVLASSESLTWGELADRSKGYAEYLTIWERARPPADLAATVAEIAAAPTPDAAARAVCEFIHANVAYRPGTTDVESVAADAWAQRSGVCQDIAHLALGCLRHLGIPARYVSGYLHPHLEPEVGVVVEAESHAWIEWWTGDWRGFDPTNNCEPGERHVVVATGRNYDDVRPLAGIYAGSGQPSNMEVKVQISRLP